MARAYLLDHNEGIKARSLEGDWLAAQVWAGREQTSAKHLRLRGYEVFLPLYSERRAWSDRLRTIRRALFPGYLFCRLPRLENRGRAIECPGLIRIIGDRNGPLSVGSAELDSVRRIVESSLPVEPCELLRTGERVRIDGGPLCGVEGAVLRVRNRCKVVVAVTLLHRAVAVEVDASTLRCLR